MKEIESGMKVYMYLIDLVVVVRNMSKAASAFTEILFNI